MTCNEFRTRLDEGQLDDAHARTCVSCNRELQAALELDRALAIVMPVAPGADFNDAVMRTIHAKPRTNAVAQIVAEPVVPIAIAIAIMIALRFDDVSAAIAHVTPISIGVAASITIATLIFWSSWRLFLIYERLTTP